MWYTFHLKSHLNKLSNVCQHLQTIEILKLRKWKQKLHVHFKSDFTLKIKDLEYDWNKKYHAFVTLFLALVSPLHLSLSYREWPTKQGEQVHRRGGRPGRHRPEWCVASSAFFLVTDESHTCFKQQQQQLCRTPLSWIKFAEHGSDYWICQYAQCLLEAFTVYPNPTSCNTQCHTSSENVILVKGAWTLFSGSILSLF